MGVRIWGFRVWGFRVSGFRVWGLGVCGFRVWGLGVCCSGDARPRTSHMQEEEDCAALQEWLGLQGELLGRGRLFRVFQSTSPHLKSNLWRSRRLLKSPCDFMGGVSSPVPRRHHWLPWRYHQGNGHEAWSPGLRFKGELGCIPVSCCRSWSKRSRCSGRTPPT